MKTSKLCEKCQFNEAVKGGRFCSQCGKSILAELRSIGYLTKIKFNDHVGQNRISECKENTYETKYGRD